MRIDSLINSHTGTAELQRDFGFLSSSELEEFEELLQQADPWDETLETLSEAKQRRIKHLLKKTEGNVISSWHQQAEITGNQSLRDLFNDYRAYCKKHEYFSEGIIMFRNKLKDFGINVNSNIQ